MTRTELKRKEIIERELISSMDNLDQALTQIVALDTNRDNGNYSKLSQAKTTIKKILQKDYDKLACNRRS